jgi:[ribosomal protein S5]-alanine N-acetyltransferase
MILKDKEIILRAFSFSDAKKMAVLCNNKKIWDNVRDYIPFPYNEKHAIEYIQNCQNEEIQTTFAIEYKGDFAGCVGLVKQTDVYKLTAEIGYWLGEEYWGLGITTRAVRLLCEYAFNELGLIRIYTGVFDFNIASQRVLEKAGFSLECVFKKSIIKNNRIGDEYRYALINE